jgi:UDP-3-O-[3-hydroxymyristoyl] glucosamine N-acyltransferase
MSPIQYSVAELAQRFALEFKGDGARVIDGVGTLSGAGPSQLSFLSNSKYAAQLAATRAGVVVLNSDAVDSCPTSALIARDPYVAYAHIAALFERLPAAAQGVHPSAVVAPGAHVSATASIGACCVIEDGAIVEDGAVLGPHCIIGPDCTVGAQSRLVARVTLVTRVTLGKRVLVHPGAVIGSDGFGLAFDRDHWVKLPQLGGVRIGDDCEIGANTTIDRGALDDTVLEEDVRLDNQIQVAHNVYIGAHTAMAGCAAVAGSAKIGRYCMIGGNAGAS